MGTQPLAEELRAMLGDQSEFDACLLEDIWTYGLASTVQQRRVQRGKTDTRPAQDCSFADVDGMSAWAWMRDSLGVDDTLQTVPWTAPMGVYWSMGAPGFSSAMNAYLSEQENLDGATCFDADLGDLVNNCPMTEASACKLLRVNEGSSEAVIKAAYRGLVNRWHPDRFVGGSELEQTNATKRMTSINEAYRVIRCVANNG
ncbi:MAG: J domain-containing protein [Acidobacteriaceae bacterium]